MEYNDMNLITKSWDTSYKEKTLSREEQDSSKTWSNSNIRWKNLLDGNICRETSSHDYVHKGDMVTR